LLIGDPALQAVEFLKRRPDPQITVYDLAAEWMNLTGLPFVFAAWAARRDADAKDTEVLSTLLSRTRDEGLQQISQLVEEVGPQSRGLSTALIEDYLSNAIRFHLTPQRRAGMVEFERRVRAHGLA
jgi:chorismate dehydratase